MVVTQCHLALRKGEFLSVKNKIKARYFPGTTTDDMYNYTKPLLKNLSDNMWCVARFGTICTI